MSSLVLGHDKLTKSLGQMAIHNAWKYFVGDCGSRRTQNVKWLQTVVLHLVPQLFQLNLMAPSHLSSTSIVATSHGR